MSLFCSLLAILALNSVAAIHIECNFDSTGWCHHFYGCQVISINITSLFDSTITSINGTHLANHTDANVTCFSVQELSVNYFPHGLADYFPNLSEIVIDSAGLIQIIKEDLREFGNKLKTVKLNSNQLTRIDHDLFKFNPNIERIFLDRNRILKVGYGVFDHLEDLHSLDFEANDCYDDYVYYDRNAVLRLVSKIYRKCP